MAVRWPIGLTKPWNHQGKDCNQTADEHRKPVRHCTKTPHPDECLLLRVCASLTKPVLQVNTLQGSDFVVFVSWRSVNLRANSEANNVTATVRTTTAPAARTA